MTAASEPSAPTVSVLVGSRDGMGGLPECLDSIDRERDAGVSVVVAIEDDGETPARIRERFPWAVVVPVRGRPNLGALRAAAYARADGRIVAFTDAHCTVGPGWIAAIRAAISGGADAAGGAVLNGTPGTTADWAAFLYDYGGFLPPIAAGTGTGLPGNNVAFRREVLGEPADYEGPGLWKYFVALRLARQGRRLVIDPRMVVAWRRRTSIAALARDRFHFGRALAARRLDAGSAGFRLAYRLAAPLLPAVVACRLFARLLGHEPARARAIRAALPLLLAGLAWGAGEAAGALLGRGDSERHVY